ncbi:MAG: S9 family peptidase [Verrucomicrobiales bacterium]|nr:S9 family peptidase [Verrucomicrobiales bacterium]
MQSATALLLATLTTTTAWSAPDKYPIEDFLDSTSFRGASFSPDNTKILVSSDATGILNANAIPTDGSAITPLTKSTTDSVYASAYFPHDQRFIYSSDQGGNELNHVFVRQLDGTAKDLTPGEKLKASFDGFSHDTKSFFISTNERDPKYFDLYEYDITTYERTLIYQNDDGYAGTVISPDKRFVALAKNDTRDNSDIYLHDRETGTTRHLTPHEGNINFRPADFTPDGKHLLVTTDRDSDFKYLAKISLTGENPKTVPFKKYAWDTAFAYYTHGGNYLVTLVNQDGSNDLHVYNAKTMDEIDLPTIPDAEITSVRFSRNEKHLALYVSSGRRPSDLFYYQLGSETPPKQLTRSLSKKIDPAHLVEGKVVRFDSFDGVEIPGILYTPQDASPDNKRPALVWVHGGPGGQSRIGYRSLIQYLVNHGYVVYAINNRGSSGYGNKFQQLDDRKHGEGDLDDCVTSKKMLIATGVVDPGRIGIMGGSYGGYMTCAALTFRPEAFRLGVNIFGVTNWVRTLASIPPWWESARKSLQNEMGDFDDTEYLTSISPLFHAEKITKPLMVLQGANDPRVLKVESDEIVAAAKKNGVPVDYVVFPDEGHGFAKKANQAKGYKAILTFLNKHLAN